MLRRGPVLLALAVVCAAPAVSFVLARGALGVANAVLERRFPPPGRLVMVGDHRLHLYCLGAGQPTVVIEPGLGVDWVGWAAVVLSTAEMTRVCVYDRAGYGWSEAGPEPRSALRLATELHDMLDSSGEAGPYVLVAHSFGAFVARTYAGRFVPLVGAVVLVDPSVEVETVPVASERRPASVADRVLALIPPLGWERLKRLARGTSSLPPWLRALPVAFQHRAVIASSLDQLAAEQNELNARGLSAEEADAVPFPRDIPLFVVTPEGLEAGGATKEPMARHQALVAMSAEGRHIIAVRSGHFVQQDQPELVERTIADAVARARLRLRTAGGPS